MATETEPTTPAETEASPLPNETWGQRIGRKWIGLKMADTALQIAKDANRQKSIARLIKKTQDGTIGQPTHEPGDEPRGSDEMGVHVGDIIHHTIAPPAASQAPAAAATSFAAKALTAGALVLGGAGALPLGSAILSALTSAPAATAPAFPTPIATPPAAPSSPASSPAGTPHVTIPAPQATPAPTPNLAPPFNASDWQLQIVN